MSQRVLALCATLALVLATLVSVPAATLAASPLAASPQAYQVTAKASTKTVTLGDAVKLTGTVRPKASGQAVLVQEVLRGKWKTVSSAKLGKDGSYRASFRPSKGGKRTVRVCKPAAGRTAVGCSASLVVKAYQWTYLYDLDAVDGNGLYTQDPTAINGRTYKKSLVSTYSSGTMFREYNISRKCTQFRGTLGVGDESETGANGEIEVLVDSQSRFTGLYAFGQSEAVTLDVSNGLRIRFETTTDSDGLDEYLAIGSPQVYCI